MKIFEIVTEDLYNSDTEENPIVRQSLRMKQDLLELSRYLQHYCQPYITKIDGLENALFKYPLYRGVRQEDLVNMHLTQQSTFDSINIRKDRLPMDTPRSVNTDIDAWFEKRTGIRFRTQSLFCSGSASLSGGYGTNVVVIPMGDFDYCWSPKYRDMYEYLESYADSAYDTDGEDEHELMYLNIKEKIKSVFSDSANLSYFLDEGDYQFDNNLIAGVHSGNEMMIAGNKAVVIYSNWLLEAKYHYENEGWKL